jgi:hypothetical protein
MLNSNKSLQRYSVDKKRTTNIVCVFGLELIAKQLVFNTKEQQ